MKQPKSTSRNYSDVKTRHKHIALFKKSGMSQKRYCEESNLNIYTFRGWLKKNKSIPELRTTKIPGKITRQIFTKDSGLELKVGETFTIKIPEDFNPDVLRKILNTLEIFK